MERQLHHTSIRSSTHDHDSSSNSSFYCDEEAGPPITETVGVRLPAGLREVPCMRAGGAGWLRNIQYSRTASFRAMATLATALPRRNFKR
jgi:hypothetical protein